VSALCCVPSACVVRNGVAATNGVALQNAGDLAAGQFAAKVRTGAADSKVPPNPGSPLPYEQPGFPVPSLNPPGPTSTSAAVVFVIDKFSGASSARVRCRNGRFSSSFRQGSFAFAATLRRWSPN